MIEEILPIEGSIPQPLTNTSEFYAQIDSNNIVIAVSELSGTVAASSLVLLDEFDPSLLGKVWDNVLKTFNDPADTKTYIKATLDQEFYNSSDTIIATLDIKDSSDNIVPVNGTYYVPILRTSDGFQAAFLQLFLVNGHAVTSFSITEPGIYTVNLDKCYPTPTSVMQDNLTFVVTS